MLERIAGNGVRTIIVETANPAELLHHQVSGEAGYAA
jgi:hypothetical protein